MNADEPKGTAKILQLTPALPGWAMVKVGRQGEKQEVEVWAEPIAAWALVEKTYTADGEVLQSIQPVLRGSYGGMDIPPVDGAGIGPGPYNVGIMVPGESLAGDWYQTAMKEFESSEKLWEQDLADNPPDPSFASDALKKDPRP